VEVALFYNAPEDLNPYEAYDIDTRTHVSLITTTRVHTVSSTAQLEGQEESQLTTLAD